MLSEQTVSYLAARNQDVEEISWSEQINNAFKLLRFLSQNSLPTLQEKEWELLFNVYAGSQSILHPPFRVASDILDHFGEISVDALKPEHKGFVLKAHTWSQAQQFAVLDHVTKFWAKEHVDYVNLDDLMNKLGSL